MVHLQQLATVYICSWYDGKTLEQRRHLKKITSYTIKPILTCDVSLNFIGLNYTN